MKISLNLKLVPGLLSAAVLFLAISCGKMDVVGNDSVRAFSELLQKASQLVSEDGEFGGWSISAPDSSARFVWSKDFAASRKYDVLMEFAAAPFIEAGGLIPDNLPESFTYRDGMITIGVKFGNEQFQYEVAPTPLDSYQHIVKHKRNIIGYHGQLDHYGINIGDGNMFEWAKNMATNDKDIVFVLNPAPFIAAKTDVTKIEGWLFAKVTVDDENGKPTQVDKLLKPFNLN